MSNCLEAVQPPKPPPSSNRLTSRHIGAVRTHVDEAPLEDLLHDGRVHGWLCGLVCLPRCLWVGKEEVGGLLDGPHEGLDLWAVGEEKGLVGDVEDGAEAAAAQVAQPAVRERGGRKGWTVSRA